MKFSDNMTLGAARNQLRTLVDDGHKCPCCSQFAKVYTRKLNSGMAISLISMFKAGGSDWIHLPTEIGARSREEGKLRYWGLVEERNATREDGGHAGWWRVTGHGVSFVLKRLRVRSHVRIYDGRRLGLTGDFVTIDQCLGRRFDYAELMAS